MDVDSTLVATEGIDLLAELAGSGPQVAAITDRAMRGDADFATSLRERVATLRGLPLSAIGQANALVRLNPGARDLIDALHAEGWAVGLVSGGFTAMVEPLARLVGADHFRANQLAADAESLTGTLTGPVIDRAAKAAALREWAAADGVDLAHTAAMGDGANDLDMFKEAAVSIAYGTKPAAVDAADCAIEGSLMGALPILLRRFSPFRSAE
jgi:phosphoserine phosphatase